MSKKMKNNSLILILLTSLFFAKTAEVPLDPIKPISPESHSGDTHEPVDPSEPVNIPHEGTHPTGTTSVPSSSGTGTIHSGDISGLPVTTGGDSSTTVIQPGSDTTGSSITPQERAAIIDQTNNPSLITQAIQAITGTPKVTAADPGLTPAQQMLLNTFLAGFATDPNFTIADAHLADAMSTADLRMAQKLFYTAKDISVYKVKALGELPSQEQALVNIVINSADMMALLRTGSGIQTYKATITALVAADKLISQAYNDPSLGTVSVSSDSIITKLQNANPDVKEELGLLARIIEQAQTDPSYEAENNLTGLFAVYVQKPGFFARLLGYKATVGLSDGYLRRMSDEEKSALVYVIKSTTPSWLKAESTYSSAEVMSNVQSNMNADVMNKNQYSAQVKEIQDEQKQLAVMGLKLSAIDQERLTYLQQRIENIDMLQNQLASLGTNQELYDAFGTEAGALATIVAQVVQGVDDNQPIFLKVLNDPHFSEYATSFTNGPNVYRAKLTSLVPWFDAAQELFNVYRGDVFIPSGTSIQDVLDSLIQKKKMRVEGNHYFCQMSATEVRVFDKDMLENFLRVFLSNY